MDHSRHSSMGQWKCTSSRNRRCLLWLCDIPSAHQFPIAAHSHLYDSIAYALGVWAISYSHVTPHSQQNNCMHTSPTVQGDSMGCAQNQGSIGCVQHHTDWVLPGPPSHAQEIYRVACDETDRIVNMGHLVSWFIEHYAASRVTVN